MDVERQRAHSMSSRPLPVVASPHGPAALRTVFRIFDAWGIKTAQAMTLLGVQRSTYFRWKQDPNSAHLSPDTLERISYLFGIYKDLQILLPDSGAADTWVLRSNDAPLFQGRPPIERMSAGRVADLYVVRRYLDAARGDKV